MYAVPDVDEVVAVAKELGIHLSPDEAVKYQKYLVEQLGQLGHLRAGPVGGAQTSDGLYRPRARVPAERGRRPAQRLDVGNAESKGRPKVCLPARPSVTRTTSPWQAYP